MSINTSYRNPAGNTIQDPAKLEKIIEQSEPNKYKSITLMVIGSLMVSYGVLKSGYEDHIDNAWRNFAVAMTGVSMIGVGVWRFLDNYFDTFDAQKQLAEMQKEV